MSNLTRQLVRSRCLRTSSLNNTVTLGAVTTATKSQQCGHPSRTSTGVKHLHHLKQISTSSTIESANSHEVGTKVERPSSRPLAALPMSTLLRSLFVSSVCSKPYLLGPSLSVLSFLSQPNRTSLLSIERNPLLYWLVKRTLFDQFCVGENEADSKKTMKKMHELGFSGIILTYAKETTFDYKSKKEHIPGSTLQPADTAGQKCEEIESWRMGTLQTVHMTSDGDRVAIKMTGAGALATKAFAAGELPPKQMMDALHEICEAAHRTKSSIVIDAESQHFQRGIARTAVTLMRKYNTEKSPLVYHTYQCYLKDTRQRLAKDLVLAAQEGWTIGVKLVRGAYMASDERSKIHDTKEDTDHAYNSIVRDLLRRDTSGFSELEKLGGKQFPQMSVILATHNKESVMAAHRLNQEMKEGGINAVPVEFAQLHGMADALSFSLLQAKSTHGEAPKVSKCSTWGPLSECLAYLLRRAIENREAVSRTQDELKAVRSEFRRRVFSVVGL